MKYLATFIIFIMSCSYLTNVHPANNDASIYSNFLKASYLYNSGDLKASLEIFLQLKDLSEDEYLYIMLSEVYVKMGRVDKAAYVLEEAINNDEITASDLLYYKAGLIYAKFFKNCEKAISYMERATKYENEVNYLETLAVCFEGKSDYASAVGTYDKLIKAYDSPEYHYNKGKLLTKLGLLERSKQEYLVAVKMNNHLRSMLNLAEIYIAEKHLKEAIDILEKTRLFHGNILVAEERLAELYREEGSLDKAIELFESVLDDVEGKQKIFVLKQLGLIYLEMKKYEDAKRYFIEAVKEDRLDYQTLYFAGYTSELMGELKEAENYYNEILLTRDDFTQVIKRLAIVYLGEKEFEKSIANIDSIADDKKDLEYFRIKAAIYLDQELLDKSLSILNEGLLLFQNSEDLLMDQAIIYEKLENYDRCIESLKSVLDLNPENYSALNFLGYLYADLDMNLDEAYSFIDKALKNEPDSAAYIDSMAWVLYRLKRYKEAYNYQKKALKMFPDEIEFIKHMEAILKAMNSGKTIDEVINKM